MKTRRQVYLVAKCEVCGVDPAVVFPAMAALGLASNPHVKGDEVELRVQARVIELRVQPRRVEEGRVQHADGRFFGVKAADVAEQRVCDIVNGRKVIRAAEVDERHLGSNVDGEESQGGGIRILDLVRNKSTKRRP
jgi:hypothetical protein